MSQTLFKTGGQCLTIFWFVNDIYYWCLRNMGTWKHTVVSVSCSGRAFILCLLLSTWKSRANFPFWRLGAVHTYFRAEIRLAMSYIFIVQYISLNFWDKLFSAANLACWEACVGMTQLGDNKKVKKGANIVDCDFTCLLTFDFRMKGCLMKHHLLTCSSTFLAHSSCAPWTLHWISSVSNVFLYLVPCKVQCCCCPQEWASAAQRDSVSSKWHHQWHQDLNRGLPVG